MPRREHEFTVSNVELPKSAARLEISFVKVLKGNRSPGTIINNLEDDTWYQVSAVAERAEGVFSEPVFAVVKTHREPAPVTETTAKPLQGTIDSLTLFFRLDCSAALTGEVCGLLRFEICQRGMTTLPWQLVCHTVHRKVENMRPIGYHMRIRSSVKTFYSPSPVTCCMDIVE